MAEYGYTGPKCDEPHCQTCGNHCEDLTCEKCWPKEDLVGEITPSPIIYSIVTLIGGHGSGDTVVWASNSFNYKTSKNTYWPVLFSVKNFLGNPEKEFTVLIEEDLISYLSTISPKNPSDGQPNLLAGLMNV